MANPTRSYSAYQEGLEHAAQIVRYYLKYQNQPAHWKRMSEYERGVEVTCNNLNELIQKEAILPESEARHWQDHLAWQRRQENPDG